MSTILTPGNDDWKETLSLRRFVVQSPNHSTLPFGAERGVQFEASHSLTNQSTLFLGWARRAVSGFAI
ncbi:MAG: hypothetical protein M3Y84_02870 [Acidobacteriota bacterium]|nr:hypothetical protein [Acidobacteriota bacterium]